MPKEKTSLNGSSGLLAKAIRKVFEEVQENTVDPVLDLMNEVKDEMKGVKGEIQDVSRGLVEMDGKMATKENVLRSEKTKSESNQS